MAIEKSSKTLIIAGIGVLVVASILIGVGSWCLAFVDVPRSSTVENEYMLVDICRDTETNQPCRNFIPDPILYKCDCPFYWELKQGLKGDVTLYYKLEFDQTNKAYASSKDDQQLLGAPGPRPAEACGSFSYTNNMPIFPCGEIADSIFNDTFVLEREISKPDSKIKKEPVPVEYTNLVTGETLKYRNPSIEVRNNFTRPISWVGEPQSRILPWEQYNTSKKGIEHPAVRAWMDTSLKRKPVWRVQRVGEYADGLPPGNYNMFIKMHYGVNRYNGSRTMVLEGVYTEHERRNTAGGVILLLFGLSVLTLGLGYVVRELRKMGEGWRPVFQSARVYQEGGSSRRVASHSPAGHKVNVTRDGHDHSDNSETPKKKKNCT